MSASLDYTAATLRDPSPLGPSRPGEIDWARPVPGEALAIVEGQPTRPAGRRISRTTATAVIGPFLRYPAPTRHGASGAAVFNADWQLVAMHHRRGVFPDSGGTLVSQGVCISAILEEIGGWLGDRRMG
jgi:hypothetical protein